MAIQLQVRRGTAVQHASFTGAAGELTLNTTRNTLHVHNGSTAGGFETARADLTNVITGSNLALGVGGYTGATLALTSNATVGGTLGVTGNTTIGGTLGVTGDINLSGNLTITGNITVNGTTSTINSTVTTLDDPVITLGGDTAPSSDDNKDRGIEFRWHNGSAAKLGFFGYDDSASVFTFIPDATNSSEVYSGTAGGVRFGSITGTTGNFSSTLAASGATTLGSTLAVTGATTLSSTLAAGATTLASLTLTQQLGIAQGGTGQVSLPEVGQVLIGNASNGFTLNRLTGGDFIQITNTSGQISIAYTGTSGNSQIFAPQAVSDLGFVYDTNIIAEEDLGAVGGAVPLSYDLGPLRLDGVVSLSNLDQSVKSDYLGYSIIFGF